MKIYNCLLCLERTDRVDTCFEKIFLQESENRAYPPIVYGHPSEGWSRLKLTPPPRCAGCNVMLGASHHAGCIFERCPYCRPREFSRQHTLHDGVHAALCGAVTPIRRSRRPQGCIIYPARRGD